jgi:hypothetical protein
MESELRRFLYSIVEFNRIPNNRNVEENIKKDFTKSLTNSHCF